MRGHRPGRSEVGRHIGRSEATARPVARYLDHHVQPRGRVVHDREPHTTIVQPCGNLQVGIRRLEIARWVIMHEQLAAFGEAREREHARHVTTRDNARGADDAVLIQTSDEAHLASTREPDGRTDGGGRGRREAVVRHVFNGFFFAAGNNTLFRMSR